MAPIAGTAGVPTLVRTRTADQIGAMFNRIARRYDTLNRVLSLQRDQRWRRLAAQLVLADQPHTVLDIATGTADLPLMLATLDPRVRVTGVDIASEMLARGRTKAARRGVLDAITLCHGDALALPAPTASVDAVTIAFGIRNVSDYRTALGEMHRVLRPGGSVTILEFSLPPQPLLRAAYLFYFRHLLPLIGGLDLRQRRRLSLSESLGRGISPWRGIHPPAGGGRVPAAAPFGVDLRHRRHLPGAQTRLIERAPLFHRHRDAARWSK